jgi:hypothetical protein
MDFRLTDHALLEMSRRGIPKETVYEIMGSYEQEMDVRPGRKVYQARRLEGKPPRVYLYRIFVDIDRRPFEVVTVYRTSKIDKYWRTEV